MKLTLAAAFALAASSFASAQGVTAVIAPPAAAPSGCATTYTGNFEINAQNVSTAAKRGLFEKRVTECGSAGTLVINLCNGILQDALGRTGYIASNRQFQFDGPPQAGAIYTAGFSVCANGTLALGGSAVFYQCLSGTFFNLYDQSQGGQCSPAYIEIIPCTNGTTPTCGAAPASVSSAAVVSSTSTTTSSSSSSSSSSIQIANITTTATTLSTITPLTTSMITSTPSVASSAVVQSSDGQPQVTTATTSALPVQTKNAGSLLSAGQEFAAFAAGVAALVMI